MSKRRVVRTPEQRLALLEKAVRSLDRSHDAMQREIDALGAASAGHDYTSQQRDERLAERIETLEVRERVRQARYAIGRQRWIRRVLAWRPWR